MRASDTCGVTQAANDSAEYVLVLCKIRAIAISRDSNHTCHMHTLFLTHHEFIIALTVEMRAKSVQLL